jgi:clathrin heavy chain
MAFTHVTMQSEKYVCVRETGTTNNVVIVDMANPSVPIRKPITADSTILAPSSKVVALKASAAVEGGAMGDNLQVFNLDTKQKVRAYVNPVKIQFWSWISDETIALVTESAVFHWEINVCPLRSP